VTHHERFADNGGVRIRYLDNAPTEPVGLPVVFVPGITDFADEYEEMLDDFGQRRVLIVEMRGRGGSDSPPTGYSAAEQAGDVRAVIQHNGLERYHLMTFSRGTTPALEVALGAPGQVLTVSIGDYLAAEIALPPTFVESMWSSRWRGRPMPERVGRHVIEGIQADGCDRPLWEELAALKIPVLVARGSEGGLLTDEYVRRYQEVMPDVEVVVVSGSDHDLFRPSRTAYPRAVVDFIARRAPGT
jgi:pimeloyl-ACP methyl ester carboxylesterase